MEWTILIISILYGITISILIWIIVLVYKDWKKESLYVRAQEHQYHLIIVSIFSAMLTAVYIIIMYMYIGLPDV